LPTAPRTDLGQPDATEGGKGQAQAVALAADEGLGPEVNVVEEQLDVGGPGQAHHLLVLTNPDAGQALVDEEERDVARAGGGVRDRRDDEEVGVEAVADEVLAAVEGPAGSPCVRRGL
jgi:hypothetical protein